TQTKWTEHEKDWHSLVLTREQGWLISQKLRETLDQMLFLRARFSIYDLAKETGVPTHQLSAYFNRNLRMSFIDYINRLRVWYCQFLIQKGMVNSLNLKGLAYRCGFNNRNTLTIAFKKFTGLTPSEYGRSQFANGSRLRLCLTGSAERKWE